MNVLNRALVLLFAALSGAASAAVFAVATNLVAPERLLRAPWHLVFGPIAALEGAARLSLAGGALLVLAASVALVVAELWPPRRRPRQMVLSRGALGTVTVTREGIGDLVRHEGARVPGVLEIAPQVHPAREGVRIQSRVSVDPATELPELARELQSRIKTSVERHIGRPVREVRVDAQIAPLDDARIARVR